MSLRLSFAVQLDDAVRVAVAEQIERARSTAGVPARLRWLAPEALHFTLQFLGAVEQERIAVLERAVTDVAKSHAPFEAQLGTAGTFGNARRARLLWLGLVRGAEPMTALAASLQDALAPLGFPAEQRAFVAHLTVARAREPLDLRAAVAAFQLAVPAMRVERVALMRSHLAPAGARYEALAQAVLGS
jgi:2'-5' RNA ligase